MWLDPYCKSEVINDLVRQARNQQARVDWLRNKLKAAETSGFTLESKEFGKEQTQKAT